MSEFQNFLPGTEIEIVNPDIELGKIKLILFDLMGPLVCFVRVGKISWDLCAWR
jgi:hypothetical protein